MEKIIIYCIAGIVMAIIISHTIIGLKAFANTTKGGSKSFGLLFQRSIKFYTVLLIVVATIFLGLIKIIDSQAVVSILSGISGYILGNTRGNNNEQYEEHKKEGDR